MTYITVVLSNGDPFGNNFRVTDENAGSVQIFNSYIGPHETAHVSCLQNGAGYGNIITYQDNNDGIGRRFLHDGDVVNL
jgi:hypothetical protein